MAPHILIVDDDPLLREVASAAFTAAGYSVDCAEDGTKALATLRREPAELVLLDIAMPVLDGFETLAEMKADTALRDIPVIMLTALRTEKDVRRALALGVASYFAKPFEAKTLVDRVERTLRRQPKPARAAPPEPSEDAWEL